MAKVNKIQIKLVKSSIGYNFSTKRTLEALGLKKINQLVVKNDTSAIRGMIFKVNHLVECEEIKWHIF